MQIGMVGLGRMGANMVRRLGALREAAGLRRPRGEEAVSEDARTDALVVYTRRADP